MLKELLKSANIYKSYSKNKSGTVFLTHSVYEFHFLLDFTLPVWLPEVPGSRRPNWDQ